MYNTKIHIHVHIKSSTYNNFEVIGTYDQLVFVEK